jgi:hypothetical protein
MHDIRVEVVFFFSRDLSLITLSPLPPVGGEGARPGVDHDLRRGCFWEVKRKRVGPVCRHLLTASILSTIHARGRGFLN